MNLIEGPMNLEDSLGSGTFFSASVPKCTVSKCGSFKKVDAYAFFSIDTYYQKYAEFSFITLQIMEIIYKIYCVCHNAVKNKYNSH